MSELIFYRTTVKPPHLVFKYDATEKDYDQLTDEDLKAELIDGVLIMHSPASIRHGGLFAFLFFVMSSFADAQRIGRVLGSRATMRLGSLRKAEPDILFVRTESLARLKETEVEGPADLVVEILSPSTRDYDLDEKRPIYREAGIPEIWFLDDGKRVVVVDRKKNSEYQEEIVGAGRVRSSLLEGFWLEVEWLWQESLPGRLACLQKMLESAGQVPA